MGQNGHNKSFCQLEIPPQLIEKYAVRGPRYTSYPTAVEFKPSFDALEWRGALERDAFDYPAQLETPKHLALYVHIPFCRQSCYFCACHRIVSKDSTVSRPYLEALKREIINYRRLYAELQLSANDLLVEQIHWGGGSPNFFSPAEIEELYHSICKAWPVLAPEADVSVEIDPRSTTDQQLRCFAKLGFRRLSLGVQDFDPLVQDRIHRVQSFELTRHICEAAREAGFRGLNIDLIYGLPEQSERGFRRSIEQVLELRPQRVALYGYAHVSWLKKTQQVLERSQLPGPSQRIALFLAALRDFSAAGYQYIGMDHFALPDDELCKAREEGRLNRNFMGYTTHRGARVLGLGASAISSLPAAFSQNLKDIAAYQARAQSSVLPVERGCARSWDDQLRGEIIERILCDGVLDLGELAQRWEIDFWRYFADSLPRLRELSDDGLLEFGASQIRLSPLGTLFMRNVAMCFDAYLAGYVVAEKPMFSKTI